jgi:hypothetical protein
MLDLGSLGHSGTGRTGGPVVGKCSSVVSPVGSCGRFCSFDVVACRKLVGSFSHSVLRPSSSPLSFSRLHLAFLCRSRCPESELSDETYTL